MATRTAISVNGGILELLGFPLSVGSVLSLLYVNKPAVVQTESTASNAVDCSVIVNVVVVGTVIRYNFA